MIKTPEAVGDVPSMNQCVPFQTDTTSSSAVWQPRPGRNPWEWSENRTS
jgi:hypothetical protein